MAVYTTQFKAILKLFQVHFKAVLKIQSRHPMSGFKINLTKKREPNIFRLVEGILGPELFQKVRRTGRIHFHLVSPQSYFMGSSYDRKTENNNVFENPFRRLLVLDGVP